MILMVIFAIILFMAICVISLLLGIGGGIFTIFAADIIVAVAIIWFIFFRRK